MENSALSSATSSVCISLRDLERNAEGWLLDGEIRQHSHDTIALRRIILDKLLWFLRQQEYPSCALRELRLFLAYVTRGHEGEAGRWGNPSLRKQVRPSTVQTYHRHLRTFFRWMISEGVLTNSPMEGIAAPIARPDQIRPFTQDQIRSLLAAARRSKNPRRDEALLLFLFDTGLRASEICGLKFRDLEMQGRRCTVCGKGNKHRTVPFGGTVAKALWNYLRFQPRDPGEALFLSERADPLTRSGLRQMVERLAISAGIDAVRSSPHTFRHTFAVEFLRAGGNIFTLQQLLGHTDIKMTNRYVALAQADIEAQHRQFSPADRLRGTLR